MNLNVITYNIRGELWTEESSKELAGVIKEHEVDLVCLQEVVKYYNRKDRSAKRSITKELREALDDEYDSIKYLPVQSETRSVGVAILFRKETFLPLGQEYSRVFPKISQRSLLEEFGGKMMLPIRRIIMSEKFKFNKQKLFVYNAHLDYFGGDTRRIYQIQHFFDLWGMERYEDGVIEILAGDFNTWSAFGLRPVYELVSILRRFLSRKGFRELTKDIKWTQIFDAEEAEKASADGILQLSSWEKIIKRYDKNMRQKLDHIWVRGDFEVVSCERLDLELSDHYPILAKLRCKDQEDDKD